MVKGRDADTESHGTESAGTRVWMVVGRDADRESHGVGGDAALDGGGDGAARRSR